METVEEKTQELGFFDLLYGIIFEPVKTITVMVENPPYLYGLLIFALVTFVSTVANIYSNPVNLYFDSLPTWVTGTLEAFRYYWEVFAWVLGFLILFIKVGALHFLAEIYGGKGHISGLVALLSTISITGLASSFVMLVLKVMGAPGVVSIVLNFLVSLAVLAWTVILMVIGLTKNYNFSYSRAILTLLTPTAVLFAIGIISVVLLVFSLISQI